VLRFDAPDEPENGDLALDAVSIFSVICASLASDAARKANRGPLLTDCVVNTYTIVRGLLLQKLTSARRHVARATPRGMCSSAGLSLRAQFSNQGIATTCRAFAANSTRADVVGSLGPVSVGPLDAVL